MSFKRVVDFHGHLCPDLVIGGKLCEQVQALLDQDGQFPQGLSMVAENRTSALDAIQVLLGLTSGNQRLHVVDYGKHNYTLSLRAQKKAYRLMLRPRHFADEPEYQSLAGKIADGQVHREDIIQFQQFLDARVAELLEVPPDTLFQVEQADDHPFLPETATAYLNCHRCGQPVLKNHLLDHDGELYCAPCFKVVARQLCGLHDTSKKGIGSDFIYSD